MRKITPMGNSSSDLLDACGDVEKSVRKYFHGRS